ncbi:hypothetical protein EWB00_010522 [Schistosoma japonicum]|uniref:Uncharacterized protein n=1 Tax=Schistosoma japonicum TaxID=6182 RepID=A0A4Z2DP64_SCHJA|nr:hypothetical protein EWB00_010522 [Schistosoma japonicum]
MANPVNDESVWDSGEDESVLGHEVSIERMKVIETLNAPSDENNEWSHMNPVPSYDDKQENSKHSTRSPLYKVNDNNKRDNIHIPYEPPTYCRAHDIPEHLDMGHLEKNYIHSSWNCFVSTSQIKYLPIPDAKMEPISEKAHQKIHRGLRELCLALGIILSTICLFCIELLRIITLTLLKPCLQYIRFLLHIIINCFCDISYICSAHWERFIYPVISSWATYSQDVIVPVLREFRPIHIHIQQPTRTSNQTIQQC